MLIMHSIFFLEIKKKVIPQGFTSKEVYMINDKNIPLHLTGLLYFMFDYSKDSLLPSYTHQCM